MRILRSVNSLISLCRRFRDPQVQVWAMAGFSVLLVIIGHLRAWSPGSEGKNASGGSATRLLLAGARVSWTEDFGSHARETWRPQLVLGGPSSGIPAAPAKKTFSGMDLRPAMQEAAARPLQFLDRPLRQQLASTARTATPWRIQLAWSGDARGNAALVDLQRSIKAQPEASGFVIGNGSRSGDGQIESLAATRAAAGDVLNITLIGHGGSPTQNQMGALGELLQQLEALSGHLILQEQALPEDPTALAVRPPGPR